MDDEWTDESGIRIVKNQIFLSVLENFVSWEMYIIN